MKDPKGSHALHIESTYTPRCSCGWGGYTYLTASAAKNGAEMHRLAGHIAAGVRRARRSDG